MKPYDRKGSEEDDDLRRDNRTFGDFWILTDGYRVSMAEQKVRHAPKQHIIVPRAAFNKMIDWYMADQAPRKAKASKRR